MKKYHLIFLALFSIACSNKKESTAITINKEKLQVALNYLESKCFEDGIQEVVILQNGKIVFEGDSVSKRHNIWSCSKSFTSTVLGLLIEEGKLTLDTPVASVDSTLKELYPTATFRHFTTMTSGYSAAGRSRWKDENADWSFTPYTPEEPHFAPGTRYEYWDEAQMQLGRLLTMVLQEPMKDYLERKVMQTIQLGEWEWFTEQEIQGIPINNGCTNVHLHARQLAKFGQLFLQKGHWEGQQVIPAAWIEQALKAQVTASTPVFNGDRSLVKGNGSYGFNWWVNSADGLSKMPDAPLGSAYMSGLNHNVCMVIPEWEMVIVRMGVDGNPPEGKHVVWNEFLKLVGQSLQ